MKYVVPGVLTFLLLSAGEHAQPNTTLAGTENVVVYPSIAVAVNKAVVIRLPKKAIRVFVTAAGGEKGDRLVFGVGVEECPIV